MMLAEAVAAVLVGMVALWLVLRPLLGPPRLPDVVEEPVEPEETPKGVALLALKEIEFDREMGKLSDADYGYLKAKYTAEALAALRTEEGAGATDDVEALTMDTRPASVFAITNAVDRREPAAAAEALRRALVEGQPGLRILASLAGRVSDLIVVRDLAARKTPPNEIAKRAARGNARVAERLVDAAKRYRGEELEAMLIGLFEADLAIKSNVMDEEPALAAWLGEHLLAPR